MAQHDVLPPASVIICSRNRPRMLVDAVNSVLRCSPAPDEIVVVDQSDKVNPELRTMSESSPTLRYLWRPSSGLSRARNEAVAAARYDFLAFTDDDILADVAWVGTLIGCLAAAGPRTVISGRVMAGEAEAAGGFAPSTKVDLAGKTYTGR